MGLVCSYDFWYRLFYCLLYCLGCFGFVLFWFVVVVFIIGFIIIYKVMGIPSQVLAYGICCMIVWVGLY